MGGWTAESDAGEILSNMGIPTELHHALMSELRRQSKGSFGASIVW
jgi:hypothetical protein